MKNIISRFLLIFVFWNAAFSQQSTLNPDLLTFPVSPEAARLGSFGEIPVNLFYGRLEKNIELFTGNVGELSLPIQLSYNYGGNRLEETPSIMGLGWQLSVGGVVSREVRGLPDEHPRGFNNAAVKGIVDNYIATSGTITDNDANKLASGFYDGEADKYNVSVNGIRFSFKIGKDGTPAFLSKHDNKIQILRNEGNNEIIEGFILTDASANQYFFEQKEINTPFQGYNSFFEEGLPAYTSSWQLSKIIVNNGEQINFVYDDNDFKTYNFYASLQIRYNASGVGDVNNQGCTNDIIKRKILKSIDSKNFKISFNYIKLNNHEVYNKIIVKDMNDKTVSSYSFSYSGRRNVLDNIIKNNIFFYGFDYYDADLPDFANSIYDYPNNLDYWGFSNGVNNSTPFLVEGTGYNADKKPNFFETQKGALKTIYYPTGGKTEVKYEQNLAVKNGNSNNEPNVGIQLKFKSDFSENANPVKESVFTKTFDSDVVATLSHYIGNVNFIDMSIRRISGDSPVGFDPTTPYYTLVPRARAQDGIDIPKISLQLSEMAQIDSNCSSFNNCAVTKDSSGKFIIPAGTYEFKIRTDYNRTQNLEAQIDLAFFDAVAAQHTSDGGTVPVGGIRVSSTTDHPAIGDPITKYYDYTDASGFGSGIQFNGSVDLYSNYLSKETVVNGSGHQLPYAVIPHDYNVLNISSKPYNLGMNNSSPVGYLAVKECVLRSEILVSEKFLCSNCGGNFGSSANNSVSYTYLPGSEKYGVKKMVYPEGYKMTQFNRPSLTLTTFPSQPAGQDLSVGSEKSKLIYSNNRVNTVGKKLSEETNLYFDTEDSDHVPMTIINNPNYPKSLKIDYKVVRSFAQEIGPLNTVKDFYYFNVYKEFDSDKFIYNKKTTEYYKDEPVDRTVEIEYNDHYKQKKVTTTYDIKTKVVNEIFYPYDFADAVSQAMVNKNFVSPVVQIVNKKNGEVSDSYKYEFKSVLSNLFKPVSFSKGINVNPVEKRKFYGYDLSGNVNFIGSVTTDNTTPALMTTDANITVVWGYNRSQVVAKIESIKPVVIPANLITAIENASSRTGNEASLITALSALRNDSALDNSMVTTYTYIPLIGISSMTDPKGLVSYYEYDELNRLKSVRDKDKNILQVYRYNYKGQIIYENTRQSQVFTKNDCPVGGSSSPIEYVVSAGVYTSTISQEDANRKALADINANGQANANSKGDCTYRSIARSGLFRKTNCAGAGIGSDVFFSQAEGAETSTISQAHADSKGLGLFNTNGQINANAKGYCTFKSIALSGSFTKDNCDAGGVGSTVPFSQVAGAETSDISQAHADSKGLALFNTNGQINANSKGECTYRSIALSGSFTRINCDTGGVGSTVTFSQVEGAKTSTLSQADADAKGLALFNAKGEVYANTNGYCTFSSIAFSGSFTKDNCAPGGVGSSVFFSQIAGAETSTDSQAHADSKGLTLFNANGKTNANTNGYCTFANTEKSGSFTKNNCPPGGEGSTEVYIVPAGRHFSRESQVAADDLAQQDVNNNGLANANAKGYCTFYSAAITKSYAKDNCPAGSVGSSSDYSLPAGRITSRESQFDADYRANQRCDVFGQAHANNNGTCRFYNTATSGIFTKNNCPAGQWGSAVTYTVAAATHWSESSQADANMKAQNDVAQNGQNYANANGVCGFYNEQRSEDFIRNNCGTGSIGSTVTYTVPFGTYFSTASQRNANFMASSDINTNGQNYANTHGTCTYDNH